MAESTDGRRSPYGCHFQFPDPISKFAANQTTRHRLMKKRKLRSSTDSFTDTGKVNCTGGIEIEEEDSVFTSSTQSNVERTASCGDTGTTVNSSSLCELDVDGSEVLTDLLPEEPEVDHDVVSDPFDPEISTSDTECETHETALYSDSLISQSSSSLLIKQYSIRHSLTQAALADLLQLLRLHCPTPNLLPSSLYSFEKQFRSMQYPVTLHYYCSDCLQQLHDCQELECPNVSCGKDLTTARTISSFIEVPLEQQVATIFERKICSLLYPQIVHVT